MDNGCGLFKRHLDVGEVAKITLKPFHFLPIPKRSVRLDARPL
jgi:hypothetical protein